MAGDVGGIEVQAHGPEAPLAGQLQRVGALAHPRHPDGRMRFLERLDVRAQRVEQGAGLRDMPVLALVVELGLVAPQPQYDFERLARHLAVLARGAVHVEHGPVAGQTAGRHAEVEAPLGEMVEHRHPIGQLGRVVVRHQEAAGTDAHARRLQQSLGHEQVGRGVGLPGRRVVLAYPRLAEAQLISPAELLEIPLVSIVKVSLGGMRGHREESVVHGGASCPECSAGRGNGVLSRQEDRP